MVKKKWDSKKGLESVDDDIHAEVYGVVLHSSQTKDNICCRNYTIQ